MTNQKLKEKWGCLKLLIIFIILVVSIFWINHNSLSKALNERLPKTYSLLADDSILIAAKILPEVKVEAIERNKVKNPVSFLSIKDKYDLSIFRIDLQKNTPLKNLLIVKYGFFTAESRSSFNVYNEIGNHSIDFNDKAGVEPPVSQIYFSLSGYSYKSIINNDSVVYFNMLCSGFSLRYSKSGPVNLVGSLPNDLFNHIGIVPIDFLFLKRNKRLYFLTLSSASHSTRVTPGLLYDFIRN